MVRFHFHLYVERIMVVFPNGRNGEKLAKRTRQSEPHRRRYGDERANLRCSKSFTPDAKMIKGIRRPRTCTSYLYICYSGNMWHKWKRYIRIFLKAFDIVTILLPAPPLHIYIHYIYTFTNTNVIFFSMEKKMSKLMKVN